MFGVSVNSSGAIFYGMQIEAVMDRVRDNISCVVDSVGVFAKVSMPTHRAHSRVSCVLLAGWTT